MRAFHDPLKKSLKILSAFFKKLGLAYRLFYIPRKVWFPPKVCDILIYDAAGIEIFSPYLEGYSITVLHTRGESINSVVLFLSILNINFWRGKIWTAYTGSFVRFCKPKLVITFIDNSEYFYSILTSRGTVKMFIQNGIRGKLSDVFQVSSHLKEKHYKVDYMLVFGDHIGREYKKLLSGQVTVIGSIKNNCFRRTKLCVYGTVRFISQWRPLVEEGCHFALLTESGKTLHHQDFYRSERFILPLLERWCKRRGKSLEVVGFNNILSNEEKIFFDSILPAGSYTFVPQGLFPDSYELTDSAEMLVFIDSTLGYEGLARGNRVACFSTRGKDVECSSCDYGWPGDFPDSGPFWTNSQDAIEVSRILDYVSSVSDREWSEQLSLHFKGIMDYDPGNQRFVNLLKQVIYDGSDRSTAGY